MFEVYPRVSNSRCCQGRHPHWTCPSASSFCIELTENFRIPLTRWIFKIDTNCGSQCELFTQVWFSSLFFHCIWWFFLLPINTLFTQASALLCLLSQWNIWRLRTLFLKPFLSFYQATELWITETAKDLRWHHGNEDPFTFVSILRMGKNSILFRKREGNWWNWNQVSMEAIKQEGRLEKGN